MRTKAGRKATNRGGEGRRELAGGQGGGVIPSASSLAPFIRKGIEGQCVACGKAIREHYGKRNTWIGCQAVHVPQAATFMLVPALVNVGAVVGAALPVPPRAHMSADRRPISVTIKHAKRYVYEVRDRRRVPHGLTEAMQDAYNGLRKAGKPVDVQKAATLAKRPREANRRCLNALVRKHLAVKRAVEHQQAA